MSVTPSVMASHRRDDLIQKKTFECWKIKFHTHDEAKAALVSARLMRGPWAKDVEQAYYACRNCGGFHLTKAEQYPTSTAGWTV